MACTTRMRPALGEATGIEGDEAIGFAQPLGHLSDSHGHQRTMILWHRADEVLDNLALDLDERRDVLSLLPGQVGQQALEVAVQVALADLGLQHVLIGHDERGQRLHHPLEEVGGNETIAHDCLSPLCSHGVHLFASSPWPVDTGCCVEAIVMTRGYGMLPGLKEEIQ